MALAGITGLSAGQNTAAAENPGPELTVYNQGMALVKDTRTLDLKEGVQTVTVIVCTPSLRLSVRVSFTRAIPWL
jgi:hypothetical protein